MRWQIRSLAWSEHGGDGKGAARLGGPSLAGTRSTIQLPPIDLSIWSTVHPPSRPEGRVNLPSPCTMAPDCSRTRAMKALRGSHETAQGAIETQPPGEKGRGKGGDWISHPAIRSMGSGRREGGFVPFRAPPQPRNSVCPAPARLEQSVTPFRRGGGSHS